MAEGENPRSRSVTRERFDNTTGSSEFVSPDADTPIVPKEHVRDMMWNFCLASSIERFQSVPDQIFVMLSYIVGTTNTFRFPALCLKHGGVAFLIPYLTALFTIGLPILFLESAIGQYSSMPPLLMFTRFGPALAGVGFLMTFVICFKAVIISFRPANMIYVIRGMLPFSFEQRRWDNCSFSELNTTCYNVNLKCLGESKYQLHSRCYDLANTNASYSWDDQVNIITGASEALRNSPTSIFLREVLNLKGWHPSPFLVGSSTLQHAFVATMAIMGIRTYARLSPFLFLFPVTAAFALSGYTTYFFGFPNALASIERTLRPNFGELLKWQAWVHAAIHVMISLNLSDGSMITMSAMKRFNNNILRDVLCVGLMDTGIAILAAILMPPVAGFAAQKFYPMPNVADSIDKMDFFGVHWDDFPFEAFPSILSPLPGGAAFMGILYLSYVVLSSGVHYVAYEVVVMTVYRIAPQILRLDQRVARLFICCALFSISFLYTYLVCTNKSQALPVVEMFTCRLPMLFLSLSEIVIIIHYYTLKRFIANIKTMLGDPPTKFWKFLGYPVGPYWYACWLFLTPLALLLTLAGQVQEAFVDFSGDRVKQISGFCVTLLMVSVVLWVMLGLLYRSWSRGENYWNLFKTQRGWGPALPEDRRQAVFDEKAARVI